MVRHRHLLIPAVLGAALVVALAAAPRLDAGPDDAKKKKAARGSTYRNAQLGVTARAPEGWSIVADKTAAPTTWKRLATFNDKQSDAQAVLSVRPRKAATLDSLMGAVRKDWNKSAGRLALTAMRKVEASALSPVAKVIVDGSFTRKGKRTKSASGVPGPPTTMTYRVQATYYLGAGDTYLLYATARQVHWSRLRARINLMRESLRFDKQVDEGPQGEGTYRNDRIGFACQFPKNYSVVTPQRANHIVQFEGVGKNDALLGVYAFGWEQDAVADADRLIAHYEGDKGGTASTRRIELSGQEAQLVTAKAMLSGEERVVLIAIVMRGKDCFRLRASMPVGAEAKGAKVFETFLGSFRLGTPK